MNEGERMIDLKSGERQEGQLTSCRTLQVIIKTDFDLGAMGGHQSDMI